MAGRGNPSGTIRSDAIVASSTFESAVKRGLISETMIKALLSLDMHKDDNPRLRCTDFYRIQSNQELGSRRIHVPVFVATSVDESWVRHLYNAREAINEAAPGLRMYFVDHIEPAWIQVIDNKDDGCWTAGNIILNSSKVTVSLEETWPDQEKAGTALHELMHALGFGHEHQREDAERYLTYDKANLDDPSWETQFKALSDVICLSRFDPQSIMMYHHDDHNPCLKRKPEGDNVWATKPGGKQCEVLSELDKVGLNMLYRPVPHDGYRPTTETSTVGLYYCGRSTFVDAEKDIVKEAFTNGKCGPKNWANCAACRVLKTKKSEKIHSLGKWQGWTGLVYCGEEFGKQNPFHDGYCGPNNGPPCEDCAKLLLE